MKKSEFKAQIKEEIIDILEADAADIQAQQDLNAELELSKQHAADLGDALSEGNDSDKFQDDGYVNHTYNDSVIDKYNVPVEPTAVFNEDATPKGEDFTYDYEDIGQFYLEGFGKKHNLTQDQLGKLGRKIVKQLYKGDIGKAYDDVYKTSQNAAAKRLADRGQLQNPRYTDGTPVKEQDDEPKAKDLKGEPLSKIGYKLADTQKEMKRVVKKYSAAEGDEKEKLKDRLKELNKIKKELESLLESKI